MKKNLFALAGIALVAASCTQTEIVDNDNQATTRSIGFSVYTARQTRAEAQHDVTTEDLPSFQVSAIGNNAMYFKDITFTKGGDVWASETPYYWPAYKLTFYAYNKPENGTFNANITTSGQTLTYTPPTELAKQEDLVAAYAEDKTQYNESPVGALPITFKHYLTQIIVNAKCSNTNYKVKVSGVKVTNLIGEGTYKFSTETMTANETMKNSATSTDYSAELTTPKELGGTAVNVMTDGGNGKWYLIPQTVTYWGFNDVPNDEHKTYLALKVNISTNGGAQIYPTSGDAAWVAVPLGYTGLDFEQGKKYNVTIDFFKNQGAGYVDPEVPSDLDGDGNKDPGKLIVNGVITFNATVNPWGEEDITINL
ncbi:MAG: fimbrillin family protein [Bacteroidales bacterium]|nr:fimbrillin family protein [Bacteroidales bacterium]